MKKLLLLICALFCLQQVNLIYAQTTQGTEFWLSYMSNIMDLNAELKIIISAQHACTGTVSNPNTGWSVPFSVGNNSRIEIDVPVVEGYAYYNGVQQIGKQIGILVRSTDLISVYSANFRVHSFDASNILPTSALGDEYIIQTYHGLYFGEVGEGRSTTPASFMVVATEDNTIVDIVPTVETWDGHAAEKQYSVTLNRGEVYYAESDYSTTDVRDADFSGTQIKSRDRKKIAVFNGNYGTYVPKTYEALDHIYEQMYPVNYWGKRFVVVNTATRNADRIRITATGATSTTITKNGKYLTTLIPYQTYEFELTGAEGACYLEANNPIAVLLYVTGSEYLPNDAKFGDPSMVWISPIEQSITDLTFGTFQPLTAATRDHYTNLITKKGASTITVDGVNTRSQFKPVAGNPNYIYAQIPVSHGMHRVVCDAGFIGTVYGLGWCESYAYSMGSSTKNLNHQIVINDIPSAEILPTQSFCAEDAVKFYPQVEDKENIIKVIWNFGDGSPEKIATITDTLYHNYPEGNYTVSMILEVTEHYNSRYDTITTNIRLAKSSITNVYDTVCSGTTYEETGESIVLQADTTLYLIIPKEGSCDSTVIFHVTVNPSYYLEDTDTIGFNEFPYTWRDTTFTSDFLGVDDIIMDTIWFWYAKYRTTVHGCDSVVALELIIYPTYNQTESLVLCQQELPYTWRDTVFAAGSKSGDFTFHRTTINGYDSIVNLHLIVNSSYTDTIDMVICQNELPYTWRDTTFDVGTTSKEYIFNRNTINGCDSVVTLNLTVHPMYNHTETETICQSELPYTWRDTTFSVGTTSGEYVFTHSTVNGCDSVVTLNLTVGPTYNQTESLVLCQQELPYTWKDTTFDVGTMSGNIIFKRQTIHGCDSIVTLNLTVHPMYNHTETETICQNELPYTWQDTTFAVGTTSGEYVFTRSTMNGCDSVVKLNLTVHPMYNHTETETICQSELPYTWRDTTFAVGTTSGEYIFTRSTVNGCDSIVKLSLYIRPREDTQEQITICQSELPYLWRDTVFDVSTTSGIYTIQRQNEFGCETTHTLTLHVNDTIHIHIYDSVYVDSTYNKYNFDYTPPQGLDYIELYQNLTNINQCDSIVTLHLHVLNPPFVATLGEISNICADQQSFDIPLVFTDYRFNPAIVEVKFDVSARAVGFADYRQVYNGNFVTIPIPTAVTPDIYSGTINLYTDKFAQGLGFEFMIRYSSSVIEQHWNDVLALRNETLNGGYYFEEYQWYKNGEPLYAETGSYLYVGPYDELDMGAEYSVLIRRRGEENQVFTCPVIPTYHIDVQDFPTLVEHSTPLKLPIRQQTEVYVYNTTGQLVLHKTLTNDDMEIMTPNASGTYIVQLVTNQADVVTYKMIVK